MSVQGDVAELSTTSSSRTLPERVLLFLVDHWLLLINLAVFIFVALPFLAPLLAEAGYTRPALWIYAAYRITCHQLPQRSFFLGGPQPVYSLAEVQAVTGVDSLYALMHRPLVNSVLGSQTAFCQRDIAIYGSVLLAGLVFGLLRHRLRPLPFFVFLLFLIPIGVDGLTQLLGGIVPFLPPRESTWLLRTVTGALFGIGGVWLVYPRIEIGMREIRASLGR
jgi:uncharacterized membrane protein